MPATLNIKEIPMETTKVMKVKTGKDKNGIKNNLNKTLSKEVRITLWGWVKKENLVDKIIMEFMQWTNPNSITYMEQIRIRFTEDQEEGTLLGRENRIIISQKINFRIKKITKKCCALR